MQSTEDGLGSGLELVLVLWLGLGLETLGGLPLVPTKFKSSTGSDVGVELLFVRILTQNYLFNVTCNSLRRCFAFVVNRAGFETHHGRPRDGV